MTQENELFVSMPVGKAIAKLAIPTVISQIIVILYSMADTFFIGKTGDPNQLAALSIAFPIYTVLTAVANLFGIGANSLIARSLGQNDEKTARKASSFCFWGSIALTAVLCILLAALMKPILMLAGADDLTFRHTADYLLYVFVIGGAHGRGACSRTFGSGRGKNERSRHRAGIGRDSEHSSGSGFYFCLRYGRFGSRDRDGCFQHHFSDFFLGRSVQDSQRELHHHFSKAIHIEKGGFLESFIRWISCGNFGAFGVFFHLSFNGAAASS